MPSTGLFIDTNIFAKTDAGSQVQPIALRLHTPGPNEIWPADFKDQFKAGDRKYGLPLTVMVTDHCSPTTAPLQPHYSPTTAE